MLNNNFIALFKRNIDYYKINNPLEYLNFKTLYDIITNEDNKYMKIFDANTTVLAADCTLVSNPSLYYCIKTWHPISSDYLRFSARKSSFSIKNIQPDLISKVLGITINSDGTRLTIRSHQ